jgi:NitT/TauT family transport system substrate-binding protein
MKNSRIKIAVTLAVAALSAISLSACSSSASTTPGATGAETTAVRMATNPWIGYGPWFIAQDQGYFTANGITVTTTSFGSDAELNAAFISGSVDVANVATHTALLMKQAGVPMKIVQVEDISMTADAIVVSAGITSIKDLKGKKIAYEQGSTSDLLLNDALSKNGMTIADITPVPMIAADAGTALIGGKVDAAVTYEPYITTALAQGGTFKRIYTAGEEPGLISDVLIVSDKFIKANPSAISALTKSWGQSITYYNANTTAGRTIIAKGVGDDAAALATAFDGVTFYDAARNTSDLPTVFQTEAVPLVLKAAQAAGVITGDVDTSTLFDTSFVKG